MSLTVLNGGTPYVSRLAANLRRYAPTFYIVLIHEPSHVVQKDDATTRVAADGKWLGALRRRTYFTASIDPGEHHPCAIGRIGIWSHVSLRELNAKAGETYYFVTE